MIEGSTYYLWHKNYFSSTFNEKRRNIIVQLLHYQLYYWTQPKYVYKMCNKIIFQNKETKDYQTNIILKHLLSETLHHISWRLWDNINQLPRVCVIRLVPNSSVWNIEFLIFLSDIFLYSSNNTGFYIKWYGYKHLVLVK